MGFVNGSRQGWERGVSPVTVCRISLADSWLTDRYGRPLGMLVTIY
jgi:hypothetical protein